MNLRKKNTAAVREAFDNRRDYAAAEKFWSPHYYIQHSAHIVPGSRFPNGDFVPSAPTILPYYAM
jgi:hypothetical protein